MSETIITREEANKQKLVRYFTGKPCRKGHISPRYVLNGACMECMGRKIDNEPRQPSGIRLQEIEIQRTKAELRSREADIKEQNRAERTLRESAAEARQSLLKFKTLCPHASIDKLRAAAHAFAAARDPRLRFQDVACANLTSRSAGGFVGLYTLACFPADQATLVEIAKQLMKPVQLTHAEVEANRARVVASMLAQADAEASKDWPQGDPR